MTIPPVTDSRWTQFVTGGSMPEFESLAFRILLGRLGLPVTDPKKIQDCVKEIHDFFEKNTNLPSANNDLHKIIK